MAFYFKVGVREVWVIERDSKRPEIYVPASGGGHETKKPDADGWLRSEVAGAEFRAAGDGKLEIRLLQRPESIAKLP